MTERVRIAIAGAGVTGLAAGCALAEAGETSFAVFEKDAQSGGLCRTVRIGEFTFDTISHVLHFRDPEVGGFVHRMVPKTEFISRRASIWFRDRLVPYPFQTHLGFLPLADAIACIAGFAKASLSSADSSADFQAWIDANVGGGIGDRFMVPYNTKIWGASPRELSVDWMRFVPRARLGDVVRSLFRGKTIDAGYNASFQYPVMGGISALTDAMQRCAGKVELGRQISGVDLAGRTVRFDDGAQFGYDHLISTIPLPVLVTITRGLPKEIIGAASGLRASSVASVTLCLRKPVPHQQHWIYFAGPEFPFFRLFFPANVVAANAPAGASIVTAEIATPTSSEAATVDATIAALKTLGYIEGAQDIEHSHYSFEKYGYPVHDLARAERLRTITDFYAQNGVSLAGRFGSWHYSSIEDNIKEGFAAARAAAGITAKPRS